MAMAGVAWHPTGSGAMSRVTYEQRRTDGTPTGLSFTVSRRKFLWISTMLRIYRMRIPILSRAALDLVKRVVVTYRLDRRWTHLGVHRGQA